MSDPIDALVACLALEIDRKFRKWFDEASFCQSPIERYLIIAVKAVSWYLNHIKLNAVQSTPENLDVFNERLILFWPQAPVGEYRADFLFYRKEGSQLGSLIVECDGHEFHERTKEQAARDRKRDRYMQDLGLKVYRFTGSEIYRDPTRCAIQVLTWTQNMNFAALEERIRREGSRW